MDFKIAVLAGDGIGPEISVQGVDVMTAVCEKFGHKVDYNMHFVEHMPSMKWAIRSLKKLTRFVRMPMPYCSLQ